jgi:serine/threonine protein kinase
MGGMKDLVGTDLGNYHILEEVGHGGMATVYRAKDLGDRREVAIKVLSPYVAQEPKFKARFEQEIKVLLDLQHPHIVAVLDYGEIGDYSFIVMPFLISGTLRERLLQGPLPLQAAGDVLHQISQALDYAHARGVVHRDIKPSNILITDDGQAMLTDFGFARVADNSLSLTGSALIGTPAYMSPEQCRGEDATPLSDQYALGVILYQMTTGSLPYDAETPMGVVIMHATEPIPPPREFCPDLPQSVEAVIMRALEKDPRKRYPTMIAFNEAFQIALSGKRAPYPEGSRHGEWLDQPTEIFEGFKTKLAKFGIRVRTIWRSNRSTVVLFLVAFAAILWGLIGWGGQGEEIDGTQFPDLDAANATERSAELMATIDALSTANAPLPGTLLAPGEFETAVAGTLAVFVASMGTEAISNTPAATEDATVSAISSPTTESYYFVTPTRTRSRSSSTSAPGGNSSPTPTLTLTPTTSSALKPTQTPSPTMTIIQVIPSSTPPKFTSTPVPTIDPAKCKPPGHPIFGCTPTSTS